MNCRVGFIAQGQYMQFAHGFILRLAVHLRFTSLISFKLHGKPKVMQF